MIRSALVLLLLLTGCAAGQTPGTTPASPAKGDPVPVTVEKTGGFAGMKETITIDETGKWTKAGKTTSDSTSGRLTVEQSQELQKLAADPKLAAEATESRPPTKCRDAFNYSVTVGKSTVLYVECPADGPPPAVASQIVELVSKAIS